MNITLEQSFTTAVTPSPRVLETAAMFGLGVDEAHHLTIVPRTSLQLPQPGIVFITGPSGSGKSTIVSLIKQQCMQRSWRAVDLEHLPPLPELPLVDVFDVPLERAASLLAMAGLADAFVMLRTPQQLSDGQRYRLRLAHAMHLAGNEPCAIIADEFGATLDRLTAAILARHVRKRISQQQITFIAATTHDDLLEPLQPEVLIHKGLGDELHVVGDSPRSSRRTRKEQVQEREQDLPRSTRSTRRARRGRRQEIDRSNEEGEKEKQPLNAPDEQATPQHNRSTKSSPSALSACSAVTSALTLEPGALADYHALAAFHYKGAHPGAVTSGLRLVHRAPTVVGRYLKRKDVTTIIGVLLRCLPHLACTLRDEATSNRYRDLSQRQRAAMLNREVRCIARVVIHPQWRGLGLAVDLVKHALNNPEPGIIYTEALAAMGQVHPFFDKAGMVRYQRPPRPSHARLIDALEHLGLDASALASPRLVREHFVSREPEWQLFLRELRRWHRAAASRSASGAKGTDASVDDMLAAARDQLVTLPVYYLFRH